MSSENGKHNGNGNGHDDDNIVHMPTLAERDRMRREKEKQEKEWRKQYKAANKEQLINLPPVTKIMVGAFLLIHAASVLLLDPPQLFWLRETFGFKPAYYSVAFPGWPAFVGPFSYAFIHGSWMHVIMNSVMMMAFGTGVEREIGGRHMFILFMVCSLAAALIHFAIGYDSEYTMVGASGGASGLFAAVLIMLNKQGRLGTGKNGILPFVGIWIGISVIFGFLGGPDGSAIAWAAHIGGFLAGLVLFKPVLRIP